MSKDGVEKYLRKIPDWVLVDDHIERSFRFRSYLDGLEFA
jgi:pterin-4a-carbinolamine dehydratase